MSFNASTRFLFSAAFSSKLFSCTAFDSSSFLGAGLVLISVDVLIVEVVLVTGAAVVVEDDDVVGT